MKKFLLFSAMLAIAGFSNHLNAQCSESNLTAIIKSVTSTPGGCQVKMDISFTGNFNNGNKFAFIHLWESAPVNNYPNLSYVNPPTAAELANSVATIVIQNPGSNSAALYNQYVPNTSVPVSYTGVGFSKSGSTYTLTNVVIDLATCSQPVTIKGDVWSSQATDAQVVHCFNRGTITLMLNNPVVTGFKQCITPRLLNLVFTNSDPVMDASVVANVFIDVNSNGVIDAGDIDITGSLSPALANPMNLVANSAQSFIGMTYLPYSNQAMYDTKPIIVRANATAPGAASVTNTKNNINFLGSCTLLPVTFKSFTASRSNSVVALKWETASEQNNLGFAIERNSNGAWQQLAFVPSKVAGGNSSTVLSYQYNDPNTTKGISQYRIRQVDIDSRFTYSEVRSVRGEDQIGKTLVYPNPSNNGKVNVVFEETGAVKDVSLVDMSGHIVKRWNATSNNNIEIDNLAPGMYSLRVVVRETGEQSVNKIIVNGR
jgi:hypothetical protein